MEAAAKRKPLRMDIQNTQTRVQPGQVSSNLPVAASGDVEIEAYQRSPTLMAGETPGSQGRVRVWAPSRKRLWISFTGFGLASILLMALILFSRSGGGLSYLLGSMFVGCVFSARALRRPCYLTTDEAGIGITTSKSSVALRWDEITTAARIANSTLYDYPRIQLMAASPVEINLTGYPCALQYEVFELIKRRAALQPHPARPTLFVNPDRPLAEPPALMQPGSADIRKKVAGGKKITAIRLYRERFGLPLKDARMAIDSLELNLTMRAPHEVLDARIPGPDLRRDILALLSAGEERAAIKLLRRKTGAHRRMASETINLLRSTMALPAQQEPAALAKALDNGRR